MINDINQVDENAISIYGEALHCGSALYATFLFTDWGLSKCTVFYLDCSISLYVSIINNHSLKDCP